MLTECLRLFASLCGLVLSILLIERLIRIVEVVADTENGALVAVSIIVNLIPHYLQLEDDQPFALAGLWDSCEGAVPASSSYAIITTVAAEAICFIHHRMPAVLPERHWKAWLDDATPTDALPAILEEAATDFRSHTVSSLVNSRKNEGPELVRPVKRSLQGEFDFT